MQKIQIQLLVAAVSISSACKYGPDPINQNIEYPVDASSISDVSANSATEASSQAPPDSIWTGQQLEIYPIVASQADAGSNTAPDVASQADAGSNTAPDVASQADAGSNTAPDVAIQADAGSNVA